MLRRSLLNHRLIAALDDMPLSPLSPLPIPEHNVDADNVVNNLSTPLRLATSSSLE